MERERESEIHRSIARDREKEDLDDHLVILTYHFLCIRLCSWFFLRPRKVISISSMFILCNSLKNIPTRNRSLTAIILILNNKYACSTCYILPD